MPLIVELNGGLGNQFFQYAAARRLALARGVEVALDIAYLSQSRLRAYRLGHFNIQARLATPAEVERLRGQPERLDWRRFMRLKWKLRPYYLRPVVRERAEFTYDPHWLDIPSNVYLLGYWQNEKYFAAIADTIRREFTLREELSAPSAALAREIDASESVGVHVRRGDYVGDVRKDGLCTLEYYQTCAERIRQAHPGSRFYIFSDEPAWAMSHLALPGAVCVDHNGPERDFEDLHLLSRCKRFILANSSFSWWAAWLAATPGKTIFAPRRWMASAAYDTSDLVPAGWQRV